METIKDTASQYKDIKKQIRELESELYNIKQEVANYKIGFGKYKGKTLAEIAHEDLSYYSWLKRKNLIPYTINPEINIYVMSCIADKLAGEAAREYMEMKARQGYVGRYII